MAILRSLFKMVSWMFHVGVISALVFYVSFGVITGHFPPKLIHFQKAFSTVTALQNTNLLAPAADKKNTKINSGTDDEIEELTHHRTKVGSIAQNINSLLDENGLPIAEGVNESSAGVKNSDTSAVSTTPVETPKQTHYLPLLPLPSPQRNRASVTPDPSVDQSYAAVAARIRAETRRGQSNFQQQQAAE